MREDERESIESDEAIRACFRNLEAGFKVAVFWFRPSINTGGPAVKEMT